MKVSIIITCYNREKYISRAIRSALGQKFNNNEFEVIVVDDGSTDSSLDIIDDYSLEVKTLKLKQNKGLPFARNYGIRKAKGRFVVMLDSDDYIDENLINVEYLFLSMNPHWGAVSCDYIIVDNDELHINRVSGAIDPIACGIMFKKDALIDIGLYDEEMLMSEEKDLRVRFLSKYHIGHIELPLYRYRKHQDNITNDVETLNKYNEKIKNKFSDE